MRSETSRISSCVMRPATSAEPEEGVLAGDELTGPGEVDQCAALLVHLHVVEQVDVGHQDVAGVDQTVVEVKGLRAVDGAVLDALAQRVDSVEGVQDGGEALGGALTHAPADLLVLGVLSDLRHGVVSGGPAPLERREGVGGAGVGQIDESLAAFLLEDSDGVLGGIADLLHDVRHVEQVVGLAPGEHRGERPDRGQRHQRHQEQRHDLPADGLPAKAHGLPQLDPLRPGGTHVRQQTA